MACFFCYCALEQTAGLWASTFLVLRWGVTGVQMASAYLGTCLMPPLFGVIAAALSVRLMPVFLLILLTVMFITHEQLNRR